MDRNSIEMVVLKAKTAIKDYELKIRGILYGDEDGDYRLYFADVLAAGRFCPTMKVLCDLIKMGWRLKKLQRSLVNG